MTDPVDHAMEEVWEWKRKAEEATRGMSNSELIKFYQEHAEEAQRRLDVELVSLPAARARSRHRS
jgi:hypothetical protein